jgi:aspartyl aminopeptidase
MVSADNAHAKHPSYPEMSDPDNAPLLNRGVVIKYNASQRYTTDGFSDAFFRSICERAGARVQSYYNRADLPGGSTLGSISNTRVSVPTVDIGLPQLAMHSANETAGAYDLDEMVKALTEFYSSSLLKKGSKVYF